MFVPLRMTLASLAPLSARRANRLIRSFTILMAGLLIAGLMIATGAAPARAQATASVLTKFIDDIAPGELVEGADAFGPVREDIPVAPQLHGEQRIGWAFIASDFVGTTGYSGKPIHTMVAVDDDAVVISWVGLGMMAVRDPDV